MTYSIVARDTATGDLAIAVQSKFLAVGATAIYAAAGVGAVATQALTNVSYGPRALQLLGAGASARRTVHVLVASDPAAARRQVAVVDAHGVVAAYTGDGCTAFAGHRTGTGFSCQGNMLTSAAVVERMAEVMSERRHRALPERLLTALLAAQAAGGDARGQQSAAILVVRSGGGYGGFTDRLMDLRVDDHREPILELQRLVALHRLYFDKPAEEDLLPFEPLLDDIAARLGRQGYRPAADGADAVWDALERWAGRENLEERMTRRGAVDRTVLAHLVDVDEMSRREG